MSRSESLFMCSPKTVFENELEQTYLHENILQVLEEDENEYINYSVERMAENMYSNTIESISLPRTSEAKHVRKRLFSSNNKKSSSES